MYSSLFIYVVHLCFFFFLGGGGGGGEGRGTLSSLSYCVCAHESRRGDAFDPVTM